jgi:hypothetical protein
MLFVGCAGHFVDVNILNQESFVIYLIIGLSRAPRKIAVNQISARGGA